MRENGNSDVSLINKELKRTFWTKNKWMFFISVLCLSVLSALNVYISVLMQQIIDIIAEHDLERVIHVSLYSLGTFVCLIIVYLIQRQTCPAFIRRAITQYKEYVFERLLQKNLRTVSLENTSKYISLLTNDVNSIENNYLSPLFTFFMDIMGLIIAVIVMFVYSPLLAILAIVFAFLPVCISLLSGNKLADAEKTVSAQNEDFVNSVKEIFCGFFVIKTFQVEREMLTLFRSENNQTELAKFHRRKTSELVNLLAMGSGIFAQLGIFIAAAIYSIHGKGITPGTVIIFLNLMNFIVSPIMSIPTIFANRKATFELINKMANLLFEQSVISGNIIHSQLEKEIDIKNLSFAYDHCESVLKNVSVRFEKGKSYAIVGPSGSGKSTLLNVLLRTNNTYQGQVKIDGIELKDIKQSSVYELFSVIHQNVFIFNGSLKENITLFKEYSDIQLNNVIKLAGLSELVTSKGMDYICGENGANLSGGERQRISIARCLLHATDVLLVDEATASLDCITAADILNSVLDLQDMTKIVVTHYLEESALKRFDFIISISNGKVCEIGSFDELMEQKNLLYSMMMSGKES